MHIFHPFLLSSHIPGSIWLPQWPCSVNHPLYESYLETLKLFSFYVYSCLLQSLFQAPCVFFLWPVLFSKICLLAFILSTFSGWHDNSQSITPKSSCSYGLSSELQDIYQNIYWLSLFGCLIDTSKSTCTTLNLAFFLPNLILFPLV